MLRWPVQLRILLSNVRKFDRIAFYLRTVFLDKVLSAFRVYQQAGNAFFAIDRSSLFHQKLRIIFLNAPIISNGNVAHTLSLCVRALVAAVSRDLAINSDIKHSSAHSAYQFALRILFLEISFRCGGLSIERNQKPLAPEITLAITHHNRKKQIEVKRSSRVNPHEIRIFSGCPYAVVK